MNQVEGWIIVGQSGQMDCHVFFKTKAQAEAQLSQPHPDKEQRIVHLIEESEQ